MIESGSREALFGAYAFASFLMCAAALVAACLGVDAERRPLEEVCSAARDRKSVDNPAVRTIKERCRS